LTRELLKMNMQHQDNQTIQRLLTRAQAAAYCGLSCAAFSDWVRRGRLPGPIAGTARWDRRAIDTALDNASGLVTNLKHEDVFDIWKRTR
jgi:predicted DNA-binding transcriptional regulator AlpA